MEDKKLLRLLKKDPCKGMEQMMSLYSALLYTVVKGKLQGSYFISSDVEDLVAKFGQYETTYISDEPYTENGLELIVEKV